MSENIDMNKQMMTAHQTGEANGPVPVASGETNEVTGMLDQVFDLIFSSSKQVLGNIMSIGIKYGDSLNNPDNMLVVFPHEVYGFQGWNGAKKINGVMNVNQRQYLKMGWQHKPKINSHLYCLFSKAWKP